MNCITCQAAIPPAWKSAIANNLCPACGQQIYNDETKELIDGLASALAQMPNDPQGLAGWLLSNYEMRKVGDGEPTTRFFGVRSQKSPKAPGGGETSSEGEALLPHEKLQHFKKASGASNIMDRTEELRKIVHEVQGDDEVEEEEIDPEEQEANDPYVQTALEVMKKGGSKKVNKAQVAEISQQIESALENNKTLNLQRLERLAKQEELSVMGSVGKIKRSEG